MKDIPNTSWDMLFINFMMPTVSSAQWMIQFFWPHRFDNKTRGIIGSIMATNKMSQCLSWVFSKFSRSHFHVKIWTQIHHPCSKQHVCSFDTSPILIFSCLVTRESDIACWKMIYLQIFFFHTIILLVLSREWGNDPQSLVIIIPFPHSHPFPTKLGDFPAIFETTFA